MFRCGSMTYICWRIKLSIFVELLWEIKSWMNSRRWSKSDCHKTSKNITWSNQFTAYYIDLKWANGSHLCCTSLTLPSNCLYQISYFQYRTVPILIFWQIWFPSVVPFVPNTVFNWQADIARSIPNFNEI